MAAAGESWRAAETARRQVGRTRGPASLAPGEPATPELVLACCERSRDALLRSPNEAQEWLEAAERVRGRIPPFDDPWRTRDLRWAEARLRVTRGNLYMIRGHIRQAHELFEEARQAYAEMGQQFQAALAARSLAFTLSMAGRPEEARSASVEALRVLIGYGARTECYLVLNNLALVWLVLAQVRKAERIFAHLVAHLDPTHPFFPLVARNSILPLMEQKRWEAALRRAESLDQEFETDPYPLEKARTGRLIGEILLLMDRPDEALAPLQRAADLLDSLEAGHDWAQATALLGQARLSIGQRREAEKLLGAALRYYAEGGFALDLLQLMEAWAEAARQGGTGGREFAAFRRYWQFKPAPASPVEGSSDPS